MQSSLDGIAPLMRRVTDRLFFALYPDACTAADIGRLAAQLARQHGLSGRPLADERFHVTLHHVGDFDGLPHGLVQRAGMAAQTAAQTAARTAAHAATQAATQGGARGGVELLFDRAGSFVGRRQKLPFVLQGDDAALVGLTQLQRRLVAALNRGGLHSDAGARYTPHVTLLYDACRVAAHAVEPVAWQARELVLVRSLIGRSTHTALARWPLQ